MSFALCVVLWVSGLLGGAVAGCRQAPHETPPPDRTPPTRLHLPGEPGRLVEHQLGRREVHELSIDLTAGQALRATIDQIGLDVVLTLLAPSGQTLSTVDSATANQGPELLCFAAEQAGTYRLRIRAWTETLEGTYRLEVHRLDAATTATKACQEALAATESLRRSRHHLSYHDQHDAWQTIRALWQSADSPIHVVLAQGEVCRTLASQGQLTDARTCYETTLSSLRRTRWQALEPDMLNRLGLVHRRLGASAASRSSLEEGLAIAAEIGDLRSQAVVSSSLALLYQDSGDPFRAQELHEKTLQLWTLLDEPQNQAAAMQYLGQLQAESGRYREAESLLRSALEIRRSRGRKDLLAGNLVALAWTHVMRDAPEAGVPLLIRAERLFFELGDSPGRATALDRLGTALKQSGDAEKASKAYRSALALSERQEDRRSIAHSGTNLAWLLIETGHLEAARPLLRRSREIFHHLEEPDGLAHTLVAEALLAHRDDRPVAARQKLEEALALVEEIRLRARAQGHYLRSIDLWQTYYDHYIDVLDRIQRRGLDADAPRQAFLAADLSRAWHLHQLLLESRIDVRHAANPELLARETALRGELNTVLRRRADRARGDQVDATEIRTIERRRDALRRELNAVRALMRKGHDRFDELFAPRPISLSAIQSVLDADTQLLSIRLGDRQSYAFVLDQDSLQTFELPPRREIEAQAHLAYRTLLRSDQKIARRQAELVTRRLSEMILAPVFDHLTSRKLLVVAEGALLYIPFSALPIPAAGDSPGGTMMIDQFEISSLPSAAVLVALRDRARQRPEPSGWLAIFADPVYSAADPRAVASRMALESTARGAPSVHASAEAGHRPLSRLTFSEVEAEGILALIPPERRLAALGFEASRRRALSGALADYRMIHFATHALIDEKDPDLSGIALSTLTPSGRSVGGHLGLQDIYGLRLAADLVVLSGCRTALGQAVRGEGLIGLSHGFFYAGSSNLLVSLWDVDDRATSLLMQSFYSELLEGGRSPSAALRLAQLRMRDMAPRKAPPYFWAGFVLIGSSASFESRR